MKQEYKDVYIGKTRIIKNKGMSMISQETPQVKLKPKYNGKRPNGRPRVEIDLVQAEKLGELQCTLKEAASFLDIPEGTLANRLDFTSALKKGAEKGKCSLRRLQFKMAEKSPAMAIWLGKQYLGQSDTISLEHNLSDSTVEKFASLTVTELLLKANELIAKSKPQ